MEKFVDQQRALYKASKNSDNALFYGYLENFEKTLKSKTEIEQFKYYKDCLKSVIYEHDFGNLREVKEECLFCNKYEKESILPTLNGKDKESFRHVKTLIKYVSLKIQGECLGRVLGKKRIECHVKMVPHIDFVSLCESTTKKTVIFTSFVEALKETENVLKDAGLTPLLVYGETNKDLSTIVKKFEIDEDVNPLVATYNSLSTAVPLIMADNMITINAPFRNYILEQAISRVHRIGADTQVNVWMVSLDTGKEPNMSTRSSDILAWSQQQVEKILGISAPFEVTEGFESFGAGQSFQVTMEDYGIVQTVNIPKMESTNFLSSW
jgi:SNF2 family DNA or RNA helicase